MAKAKTNPLSSLALCIQGRGPWLPFSVQIGISSETEGFLFDTRLTPRDAHKLFLPQAMVANHNRCLRYKGRAARWRF
jgi:hypothetical protein